MEQQNQRKIPVKLGIIFLSACYIVIAVVLLVFPQMSLVDLSYAIGIVSMIVGVLMGLLYILRKKYLEAEEYGLAIGISAVLLGLFAVIRSAEFAVAFSQILALLVMFDCIVKLQFSMDLLRMKNGNWIGIMIASAVMAVLALMILVNPFGTDIKAKDTYTYIILLIDGILNIIVVFYRSRQAKKYLQNQMIVQPVQQDIGQ